MGLATSIMNPKVLYFRQGCSASVAARLSWQQATKIEILDSNGIPVMVLCRVKLFGFIKISFFFVYRTLSIKWDRVVALGLEALGGELY